MSETPASVIEALIAFFAVWSVLGLAGFHSYLVGTNQTTNEEIKGSWAQRHGEVVRNPYTTNSCCSNFSKIICGPSYTRYDKIIACSGYIVYTYNSEATI